MKRIVLSALLLTQGHLTAAADNSPAFKIAGKVTTLEEAAKTDQAAFYEAEMKKYEVISNLAHEKYLEHFWQQKASESKSSVEAARQKYFDKNVTVSKKEIKETLDKYKDHPSLQKLPKDEQEKMVKNSLMNKAQQELVGKIIETAKKKGELLVVYPKPAEPIYPMPLVDTDQTRYGPSPDDTKPMGCERKACPITIVEYSEFQCPFCEKVLPDVKRVLTEYKGKISWTVRDFPLSFHDRARPAAIAAKCAADQGKYWNMYTELFSNQQSLKDEDFDKYATKIGLDKNKWKECLANPGAKNAAIDANFQLGAKAGVNGTPAFFINGRKLSGALPYAEFKRVIDEELTKAKKS